MGNNSMFTLDELRSREQNRNGHVSDGEFRKMKKCFVFLGAFVLAIIVAVVVLM